MPAQMKKCCRCLEVKDVTEFGKRSKHKDGLEFACKACKLIERNNYRERHNELARKRYSEDREYFVAKSSKTQYKRRGTVLPEKYSELLKKEPRNSPKTWDDELERLKGIKQANREKYKEEYKKWSSTDRAKLLNALKSQRYRARKSNTINTLTEIDVAMVLIFQGKVCAKCGKSFDQVKYEIDHVVPVSLGGDTVLENIQLLCRSCNASKRAKIIRYIPEITETVKQSLGDLLCLH